MMRVLIYSILFLLFSCSHAVHLVHLSDHEMIKPLEMGKKVSAKSEQTVILGIVLETDYINIARNQLIGQCPNGAIKNIMTRTSTSHGFFHWKNKVYMEGLCY